MRTSVWIWLVSLIGAVLIASAAMVAQRPLPPAEFHILSGSDIGFRVEGTDSRGQPYGTWMVRVDGRWAEVGSRPVSRRLTQ